MVHGVTITINPKDMADIVLDVEPVRRRVDSKNWEKECKDDNTINGGESITEYAWVEAQVTIINEIYHIFMKHKNIHRIDPIIPNQS